MATSPPDLSLVVGLRNETELERYDRNLNELLGELRIALPGVQVLFAFLLVAPFNQRFSALTGLEQGLYLATLLCTLFSAILLIAPTLVHRFHFRLGEKAYVVHVANRLIVAGLAAFALAMTIAVLLITLYLFGTTAAAVTTGAVALAFGTVWFALPLRRRSTRLRLLGGARDSRATGGPGEAGGGRGPHEPPEAIRRLREPGPVQPRRS